MATEQPDILTKTEFAVRWGRDPSAVSKWISRGLLTGAALTPDGRVNVAEAERQLGARLDHSRSIGKIATATAASAIAPPAVARDNPISSLAAIKLREAELELRRKLEQEEERRGRYVLSDAIRREHMRELVQFIATVEQRLPELAARLEGHSGKEAVVAARRWWRSLRQDEATSARSRADSAPEFDLDRPEGWPHASPELAHAV